MEKAKLVYLIIGIIVVLMLLPFFTSNSNALASSVFSGLSEVPWIGGLFPSQGDDMGIKGATESFDKLNNVLNSCKSINTVDCFCSKEKILFPTGYSLQIEKLSEGGSLKLNDEKNNLVGSKTISGIVPCVVLDRRSDLNEFYELSSELKLVYGGKSKFYYQGKDFEFNTELTFFKKDEDSICVIDKNFAKENKDKESCS